MKKGFVFLLTALSMLMLNIRLCMAAEIADIQILRASVDSESPVAYVALRAKNASGKGIKITADELEFEASMTNGGDGRTVLLKGVKAGAGRFGHIIVVDTSMYYFRSKNIKAAHISGIIAAYLNRLSEEERVKFILAGEKGCTEIDYMALAEAKNYAAQIALGQKDPSMIYTAIYTAFEQAKEPAVDAPPYNSVFIVADPNLSTNEDSVQLLEEAVSLYNDSEEKFDVLLAMPYRASYFGTRGAAKDRTSKVNEGFATYESFASRSGGVFCRVPQDNRGVDTTELLAKILEQHNSLTLLEIDLSSLNQLLDHEGGEQEVDIRVSGKNSDRTSTASIRVDASLLPPPALTPAPTPESDPPDIPVVVLHQKDAKAFEAIRALIKLWYLEDNNYSEFDGNCWMAYVDFCQANEIDASDGIYEDAFNRLMRGDAIPAGTATPIPTTTPKATSTPVPTIRPDGYRLGDADTEESGGFIYSMQVVLQKLNCFGEEKPSSGMLDQPTLDAVTLYCETYGWNNEAADSVSAMLVNDIITNGQNREPYVEPEPSKKEKVRAFLTVELLRIGGFPISRGMMLATAGVLFFIAIIVAILVSGKKEYPVRDIIESPVKSPVESPKGESKGTGTIDVFLPVSLSITYNGTQRTLNTYIYLDKNYLIGRDSESHPNKFNLMLDSDDRRVSRPHAALYLENRPEGKVLYLCDLGSRNGTIVNGDRLSANAQGWSEDEKKDIGRGTYDFSENNEEFMKKLAAFKKESSRLVHSGDRIEIGGHQIRISW